MEPNPPIHILLFEDREEEGGHVEDLLKGHGLEFDLRRAGDFSLLHRDLAGAQWDILLARSSQLDSDASGAIEMAQELAPGLPCIVVPRDDRKVASGLLAGSDETWARLASAIQRKVYDRRLRGAIDQAQARLESVEGRLKAIAAATLDGIVITDAGGMIACWNQSAERIFGYSETEAMGSDWSLLLVPERFQGAIRTELAKLQEAAEGWGVGKALQLDARRKDGTEFPIQLTLALLRQGEAWCTLAIVRDLTSQRDQEREQFEHLQFLRTLIETLPNPLYYEDQEGQVLGCRNSSTCRWPR
jgi:PAS domain S-box-containing protein